MACILFPATSTQLLFPAVSVKLHAVATANLRIPYASEYNILSVGYDLGPTVRSMEELIPYALQYNIL